MDKNLEKIAGDKKSGSAGILTRLARYFAHFKGSSDQFESRINWCRDKLSFFEIINSFLTSLETEYKTSGLEAARQFAKRFEPAVKQLNQSLYETSIEYIKPLNNILTLSNSSTILGILTKMRAVNPQLKVILLESRPKLEGRNFAKALIKNDIKVTLITDAEAALFISDTDAVFAGADSVLKDHSVVNKTGSFILAALCRMFNRPFYVFAYENKMSESRDFRQEEEDKSEIWSYENPALTKINYYFEKVPAELVTAIFTEKRIIIPNP